MIDTFARSGDAVYAPGTRSFPIVPDDDDTLPILPKAVYVGTGGDVALRGQEDDAPLIWRNVPSGALIPFRSALVLATGTTASDLIGIA